MLNAHAQTNTFPASGNVGVGTTSPGHNLQVQKTSGNAAIMIGGGFPGSPRLQLYGLDSDGNAWMGLGTDMGGYPYEHSIYYSDYASHGRLTFGTFNGSTYATKATLLANGNFGIGTASPQVKLHIGSGSLLNSPGYGPNMNADLFASNGIVVSEGKTISYSHAYEVHGYSKYDYSYSLEGRMVHYGYYGLSLVTRQGIGFIIRGDNNNVGIGTTTPTEKLSVNGNIRAKKLIVTQQNWSDYVFYKGYKLRSLHEVEKYIQKHQHLPDMPSTKEVLANGISVGDTQALLLKKIEELTLYMIELKKENIDLKERMSKIETKK